ERRRSSRLVATRRAAFPNSEANSDANSLAQGRRRQEWGQTGTICHLARHRRLPASDASHCAGEVCAARARHSQTLSLLSLFGSCWPREFIGRAPRCSACSLWHGLRTVPWWEGELRMAENGPMRWPGPKDARTGPDIYISI